MNSWMEDAIFYHIYPLGLCGAPRHNDLATAPQARLEQLYSWMDHLQYLGINAVYLGPVFESGSHGYDTVDYYRVDRRLGDNQTLAQVVAEFHRRGIRVVLDAVFNHVGRNFWAFRDVLEHGQQSEYKDWFHLDFQKSSSYGDTFFYEGWNGYYDLVKLNLVNEDVKAHLFSAVTSWVNEFGIDGLRLDAADCLDMNFNQELAALCRSFRPDFYLMAEIIHGDYRKWANPETFDSVTNYECYKGLYSSHNDQNYFEIAWSFNRQFGEKGLYCNLPLYNFADNHDVNRVASLLKNPAHLFPLYCLLFTMPGTPSIYYGSEWGISGEKINGSDDALRPSLKLADAPWNSPNGALLFAIKDLANVRHTVKALRYGDYRQLYVSHEQFSFSRRWGDSTVLVMVNASSESIPMKLELPVEYPVRYRDILNGDETFETSGHCFEGDIGPCWGRILVSEGGAEPV